MKTLTIAETAQFLLDHDRYTILTHQRPDGDTVGSAAALCLGLRQLGKTAHVLENNEVMYLQKTEQRNSLRLYTSIGKREPLYCTALGKVLLASLPLKEFEHVARQLSYEPYTPNTITNYEDLAREVALVRKRGYATDRGEHTVDSSCLAVPIYDYTRKVMAAMSVSGHGLLDRCEEVYIYEKMRDAALDLSHHMGYTEVKLPAGRTHL